MRMKKDKIAVIDNGIKKELLDNAESITEIDFIGKDSRCRLQEIEPINHGTVCAAIIRKYTQKAEIYSLKVMHEMQSKCNLNALLDAIEFCIYEDIKIVNISLGTHNPIYVAKMGNKIEKAINAGVIIMAAGARNITVYPAGYQGVVYCDINENFKEMNGEHYQELCPNGKKAVIASGKQKIRLKDGREFVTPNYSSFSAPVVTAAVWEKKQRCESFTINTLFDSMENIQSYFCTSGCTLDDT